MKKKPKSEEGSKTPRQTISFRPVEGINEMVDAAEAATGTSASELCNAALREFLPKYVAMKAEERKKEAEDFLKKYKK